MQCDNPFSSIGTTAPSSSPSAGDNARLFAPTLVTVSVWLAESYRHSAPKSTGRFSSTFCRTTWKMLGRSWRSPIAEVMCCSSDRRFICARTQLAAFDLAEHVVEGIGELVQLERVALRRTHAVVVPVGHGARGFREREDR